MTLKPLTPEGLPPVLAEVARLTSIEVAVAVARTFGGQRMYIPHDVKPHHHLARVIGRKNAAVIARRWGGEHVRWPSARPYLHWRDAQMLRAAGKSVRQIAQKLGIDQRHAERLVSGTPKPVAAPHEGQDTAMAVPPFDQGSGVCPVCGRRPRRKRPHLPPEGQLSLFDGNGCDHSEAA